MGHLAPNQAHGKAVGSGKSLRSGALDHLMTKLPRELQDQILHHVLAASLPTNQYLHWNILSRNYEPAATPLVTRPAPSPSIAVQSGVVGRQFRIGYYAVPRPYFRPSMTRMGASRFLGVKADNTIKYEFIRGGELETVGIVEMDFEYTVPLALQIDSDTRKFWSKLYYEGTVFYITAKHIKSFEEWVKTLSKKQQQRMRFLVAEPR